MELEGSYLEVEILSPKGSIDRDVSRGCQIWLTLVISQSAFFSNTGFMKFYKLISAQSHFGKVYKVKDENMKKLHCLSFHVVCRLMF